MSKELKTDKKRSIKTSILTILVIIGGIALALFLYMPGPRLQAWREQPAVVITFLTAVFLVMLYFTWIHKSKPCLLGKIVSTIVSLMVWLPLFIISDKILSVISIVTFWVLLTCVTYLLVAKKDHDSALMSILPVEMVHYLLDLFITSRYCRFIDGFFERKFWIIALGLSLAVGVLTYFLLSKKKSKHRKKSKMNRADKVFVSVGVCILAFICIYPTVSSLNYALDRSAPVEHSLEILDKEMKVSRRHRPGYERFTVLIDGKKTNLYVTSWEFNHYEKGDFFPVKLYRGALNEPFYISGYK